MTMETTAGKPTVLIIEDQEDTAVLLRYVLEQGGFQVKHAGTGEEASRLITSAAPPEVVLLDIVLPDTNGLELLRLIRTMPQWERTPIVMLTASHEAAHMMRASALGATDYICKPLSPVGLSARLTRLLATTSRKHTQAESAGDQDRPSSGGSTGQ